MAGLWVYKIGSSDLTDIVPGRVTAVTTDDSKNPPDVGEKPAPRQETPELLKTEPETPETENNPEEIASAEETLPESVSVLRNVPVILDEYETQRQNHPYPRGPRPANPQVVVIDDQDGDINVNGELLHLLLIDPTHNIESILSVQNLSTSMLVDYFYLFHIGALSIN